jgi:hypothetical protein
VVRCEFNVGITIMNELLRAFFSAISRMMDTGFTDRKSTLNGRANPTMTLLATESLILLFGWA